MRFSMAVSRTTTTAQLASSMLRKYRRLRRPGGLRREYKKLRSLLPGATRSHQLRKKVGVVEAAYQYICELQSALLDKFSTKGIPEDLAGIVSGKVTTASDIQALALHLINNNNNNTLTNFALNASELNLDHGSPVLQANIDSASTSHQVTSSQVETTLESKSNDASLARTECASQEPISSTTDSSSTTKQQLSPSCASQPNSNTSSQSEDESFQIKEDNASQIIPSHASHQNFPLATQQRNILPLPTEPYPSQLRTNPPQTEEDPSTPLVYANSQQNQSNSTLLINGKVTFQNTCVNSSNEPNR